MSIPIEEWFYVTKLNIMAVVENTPELNEIAKLNDNIVYITISGSGDPILDGKHRSRTYVGTNCSERYFSLEFTKPIKLPDTNGKVSVSGIEEKEELLSSIKDEEKDKEAVDLNEDKRKLYNNAVFLALFILALYIVVSL
jgi:hypothetical protein